MSAAISTGVIKQAGVNVFRIARRFIFKLRHTAQLAEIGIAVQRLTKLRMFRHMGLNENSALFRINTTCEYSASVSSVARSCCAS